MHPVSDHQYRAVCEWLYEEAALLSSHSYREWLTLLTEDIRYLIPRPLFQERGQERDYGLGSPYYDDDIHSLRVRIEKLNGPPMASNAERTPSLIRLFVTNIRARIDDQDLHVQSDVLALRVRANHTTPSFLSGRREDRLCQTPDGLRLAARTVHMDQPVIEAPHFAFFL